MKVLDPGHYYELDHLDGDDKQYLCFVKREGEGYPGNVGHHEGTNLQEVIRALIDRLQYVNNQIRDWNNDIAIGDLRSALYALELRAAMRHNRKISYKDEIEKQPVCGLCGHIQCNRSCRK